jgi:hypothetical protein
VLQNIDNRDGYGRDELLAGVMNRVDKVQALGFDLLNEDCPFTDFSELYRPRW